VGIVHWNEVDGSRRAKGEMDATWQRLGDAAGAQGVGVNRVRIEPEKLPTHRRTPTAALEELFFVLGGSGLAWQDEVGSRKIYWRGVGLIGRIESLEYMDGEPPG